MALSWGMVKLAKEGVASPHSGSRGSSLTTRVGEGSSLGVEIFSSVDVFLLTSTVGEEARG